jgi:hypothetical protein
MNGRSSQNHKPSIAWGNPWLCIDIGYSFTTDVGYNPSELSMQVALKKEPKWIAHLDKRISCKNRIGGVMLSLFASNVVNREFKSRLGQAIDYQIDICCFFAKHAALMRKTKDWFAQK